MTSLSELRQKIDRIDDELAALLNSRAELALQVRQAKQQTSAAVYSPEREREIIDRVIETAGNGPFPRSALAKVFSEIISATRSLVGGLAVSFPGPECSLAHDAALKQFGETVSYRPEVSLEEVIAKLERGDANFAVLPAKSMSGGLVSKTFELLMRSKTRIIAEVDVRERLVLVGEASVLGNIRHVYSDAYSFMRSLSWLKANVPLAELVLVGSYPQALERLGEQEHSAAVLSATFAERYRRTLLANGIESDVDEQARFVVLGRDAAKPTGKDKTSILCGIADRPGALRELLQPFAELGVTLLQIESKPVRNEAWEYLFYVEVSGHEEDGPVRLALENLGAISSFTKVLGSYAAASQI